MRLATKPTVHALPPPVDRRARGGITGAGEGEEMSPGRHRIMVRAADDSGQFQTAERTPVRPDGATGYHTIDVNAA